jgi:hypothetical protein
MIFPSDGVIKYSTQKAKNEALKSNRMTPSERNRTSYSYVPVPTKTQQ